ncbi:MAG: hypothetical protein KJO38_11230 [Gammaproteobacteria bacterium]|nr:hypothetical protein [Gammaproteobacteria bacterium]
MRLSPQVDFRTSYATRTFAPVSGDVIYMSVLALNGSLTPGERDSFSGVFDFTLGPTAAPNHPTNLQDWGMGAIRSGFPVTLERSIRLEGSSDSVDAIPGTVYQLVTRISRGADGKFGQVDLWVDPVSEADALTASSARATGVDQVNTFVIYQQNMGGRSYFDELVIGDSFAEVAYFHQGDSPALNTGSDVAVSALGGSAGNVGGIDLLFDKVSAAGGLTARYLRMSAEEFEAEFGSALSGFLFLIPDRDAVSVWDIDAPGTAFGTATLTVQYDEDELPAGFDEAGLGLWHYDDVADLFEPLPVLGLDTDTNTLTVATGGFSQFVLGSAVQLPGGLVLLVSGLGALTGFGRLRGQVVPSTSRTGR